MKARLCFRNAYGTQYASIPSSSNAIQENVISSQLYRTSHEWIRCCIKNYNSALYEFTFTQKP